SSELWDFLSGESNTMETILEIINSIATVDFLNNYEYLNKIENRNNFTEYIELLQKWHLIREIELIENNSIILNSILSNKSLQRIYNQSIFKNDASYNEIRYHVLYELLN
ncbi:MAG: hypothetical protein QG635_1495, partial [Bacteroidota bacterium]|nr:hypothetical protein [Bacteroidota bacterium]